MKTISVIIPCFNEEAGIGKVLAAFPHNLLKTRGYTADIIVVNNGSTDKTTKIARSRGARVIGEPNTGKGNAVLAGFASVPRHADYVVMMDGDNTYKPVEILRMIEPLESGFAHVIVGSRLGGKMHKGSLPGSHRLANWGFTFLVRHFYLANVTDVLSGYFAFRREVIEKLVPHLTSTGFALEMEMITKSHRLGFDIYSVPITYDRREGQSKIHSARDGLTILSMLIKNLSWKPRK